MCVCTIVIVVTIVKVVIADFSTDCLLCVLFVTVRQIFVCGHKTRCVNTCWRKAHVSVVCSVHSLLIRRSCLIHNSSSRSTCLPTISTLP